MVLFSDKKNSSADNRSGTEQATQLSFPQIVSLICIFGLCLSYLL